MYELANALSLPVDTMGRYYNKTKRKIVVPDNDEDEMYRGEYFPRRYPSASLSLEYLYVYTEHCNNKTIALVTGIYETFKEADSAIAVIKTKEANAFVLKSRVYVGCMH